MEYAFPGYHYCIRELFREQQLQTHKILPSPHTTEQVPRKIKEFTEPYPLPHTHFQPHSNNWGNSEEGASGNGPMFACDFVIKENTAVPVLNPDYRLVERFFIYPQARSNMEGHIPEDRQHVLSCQSSST